MFRRLAELTFAVVGLRGTIFLLTHRTNSNYANDSPLLDLLPHIGMSRFYDCTTLGTSQGRLSDSYFYLPYQSSMVDSSGSVRFLVSIFIRS